MSDAFRLELNVRIQKVEYDLGDTEHRYPRWTATSLTVQQQEDLGELSFAQVAKVLAKFYAYAVAEELKKELAGGDAPVAVRDDAMPG